MFTIAKLNMQNEQTWANLQKHLNSVQFDYKQLFMTQEVQDFVRNKVISVGNLEGYFIPSLLTTTAFILASKNVLVDTPTHKQPLNIFTIFVGYPGTGKCFLRNNLFVNNVSKPVREHFLRTKILFLMITTGKSSAIQSAAQELLEFINHDGDRISKTTSSGLVKFLSTSKKGFTLSPEVFDILNKLMKSDKDNATSDVQLLCKLFSGERSSYHYSMENTRQIPPNIPFSILGSTQLVNTAKLIARMDQGHGLVDRILFTTPLPYRPTLTEIEATKGHLAMEEVDNFKQLFQNIDNAVQTEYSFDNEAMVLLP